MHRLLMVITLDKCNFEIMKRSPLSPDPADARIRRTDCLNALRTVDLRDSQYQPHSARRDAATVVIEFGFSAFAIFVALRWVKWAFRKHMWIYRLPEVTVLVIVIVSISELQVVRRLTSPTCLAFSPLESACPLTKQDGGGVPLGFCRVIID
jgi:hypothetical protein